MDNSSWFAKLEQTQTSYLLLATLTSTVLAAGILCQIGLFGWVYVSAGHLSSVHLPSGDDPVILESQGFPIGLADGSYEERSVRLGKGDRLYLYFDGVSEAMDPAGQQFGDARLLAAICQGRSEPLQESITTLLREIARWQEPERPQDDISILAVEVLVGSGLGEPGTESVDGLRAPPRTQ